MPRLSANLTMLFTEYPFEQRFAAAAQHGFSAVEYLFPYAFDAAELTGRLRDHNLQQVLHNFPAGDWAGGDRGLACLPSRRDAFKASVDQALAYADALDCPRLNCLAGIKPDGVPDALAWEVLAENLTYAASALKQHGKTLLLEPINTTVDMPGYFIDTCAKALALLEAVNADNLRIQFDIYHAHIMEADVEQALIHCLPQIGHMQLADAPGRHEPGSGEIAIQTLFARLDQSGYDGWLGLEYHPASTTSAGLAWLDHYTHWRFDGGDA